MEAKIRLYLYNKILFIVGKLNKNACGLIKINYIILILIMSSCMSSSANNESIIVPEANRFEVEELLDGLNQPMAMDFLKDGRVIIAEKEGTIKLFDPKKMNVNELGTIPVNKRYNRPFTTSGDEYDADDGMHGLALDPNFEKNGFVYFYYSPDSKDPISRISRFVIESNSLDMGSENILLEWRTQRETCCHLGGGMIFDDDGNLYIATGDNSGGNINSRYGDSRRTSGNTNDLRGSILRIKPEDNGSYSIPEGNLFSEDDSNTRSEIYIMGVRNPWRLSLDSKTGWLYWGEVGPSTDEFNQARNAANFGWPFFIADNKKNLNIDIEYDTTRIINNSPYNTGLSELPIPPVPALVWYDRNPSKEFPIPGSGSLSAVGGPFYRMADFDNASTSFPAYYDGKWFVTDYVRGWILAIDFDEHGDYKSLEHFLPDVEFTGIIDMNFSPSGDLYILQYGHESYKAYSKDAKLYRIKYNDGNRRPIAKTSANVNSGDVPLEVALSSEGTIDYDDNIIKYEWRLESEDGNVDYYNEPNPNIIINDSGIYTATLTVTDSKGEYDTHSTVIVAGNEPPVVDIEITNSNDFFYFPGDHIEYSINISDKEDGVINMSNVITWSDFIPKDKGVYEFLDLLSSRDENISARSIIGKSLIETNNCYQCHNQYETSVGPSFSDIVVSYEDEIMNESITNSIIHGSSGKWGAAIMPSHPSITVNEANYIAEYISESLNKRHDNMMIPLSGTISIPEDINANHLVIEASYTDGGYKDITPLTTNSVKILNNPYLYASDSDSVSNMRVYTPHFLQPNHLITNDSDSFFAFYEVDLSNINLIGFDIVNFDSIDNGDWSLSITANTGTEDMLASSSLNELDKLSEGYYGLEIESINKYADVYLKFSNSNYSEEDNIEIRGIKFYSN